MTKNDKVKFKHLVDFYLRSGDSFYESLKFMDSNKILVNLHTKPKTALDSDNAEGSSAKDVLLEQLEMTDDFNERLLKAMCLNKAISKLSREMKTLTDVRNQILSVMEDQVESEKLEHLLQQMKTQTSITKTNFGFQNTHITENDMVSKASSIAEQYAS